MGLASAARGELRAASVVTIVEGGFSAHDCQPGRVQFAEIMFRRLVQEQTKNPREAARPQRV